MGLRFRKSVSICKGVRVNFNKNSIGLSIGTRGARYSINSKGRRTATVGIPGTGLSYSTSYTKNSNNRNNVKQTVRTEIKLFMNENGEMTYKYSDGREITDTYIINQIKRSPQYKMEKERMQKEHDSQILNEVKEYNQKNNELLNIYKLCSKHVKTLEYYKYKKDKLEVQKYQKKIFSIDKPSEEYVKEELLSEAKRKIKSIAFWSLKSKYEKYVNLNIKNRLSEEIEKWNREKECFEKLEQDKETEQNRLYQEEYEIEKDSLEKSIKGDEEYINNAIEVWLSELETPLEFDIQFEYNKNTKILGIDLDLPEIEDFPNQKAIQLASGNLKLKNKTQAELKSDYVTYVFGLAVFIVSHLFNISPMIDNIIISAFTQRRDKIGNINDDYIYSIKFDRVGFSELKFNNVTAYQICMMFENRCNLSAANTFKNIIPFDFENN